MRNRDASRRGKYDPQSGDSNLHCSTTKGIVLVQTLLSTLLQFASNNFFGAEFVSSGFLMLMCVIGVFALAIEIQSKASKYPGFIKNLICDKIGRNSVCKEVS